MIEERRDEIVSLLEGGEEERALRRALDFSREFSATDKRVGNEKTVLRLFFEKENGGDVKDSLRRMLEEIAAGFDAAGGGGNGAAGFTGKNIKKKYGGFRSRGLFSLNLDKVLLYFMGSFVSDIMLSYCPALLIISR